MCLFFLFLLRGLSLGSNISQLEVNSVSRKIIALALLNRQDYVSPVDIIYGWNVFDDLDVWLLHNPHPLEPQSIKILKNISADMLLHFEEYPAYYSQVTTFLDNIMKRTLGFVRLFQLVPTPERSHELLSEELLPILGPDYKSFQEFFGKRVPLSPSTAIEDAIANIQPPLKRKLFKEGYEHLLKFAGGLVSLRELNNGDISAPAGSKCPKDPQENLSQWVDILENSLSRIFIVDHRLTGLRLYTSWSLAQYLKYTSRLTSDLTLRNRIRVSVEKYLEGLKGFIESTRDSLEPRQILFLTNEKRVCLDPTGSVLREAHFIEVPCTSGGLPVCHYSFVKRGPDGYEPYISTKMDGSQIDIFVYLSKQIFDSEEALKKYRDKIINSFCSK